MAAITELDFYRAGLRTALIDGKDATGYRAEIRRIIGDIEAATARTDEEEAEARRLDEERIRRNRVRILADAFGLITARTAAFQPPKFEEEGK